MKRVAAALLICQVGVASAADLGRLFFTPQQRAQLDIARKQRAHRPVIEAAAEEALPPTSVVTYSGVVQRSDGHSTVWINNRAVHDRSHTAPTEPRARVDDSGAASITLPQQQRSIRLKVGQTAEVASGHVVESYARRPASPAAATPAAPHAEPLLRQRRKYDHDREPDVPSSDPAP
jgi:hypothetical protein